MQICSGNESSGRADGEGPQVLGVKVDRRRDKKLQVRWEIYGILRILAVIEPAGNVASPDATSCNFSRCELLQSEDITRGEWISWGLAFLCKCNNSNTTDFFGHIKPLSGFDQRKYNSHFMESPATRPSSTTFSPPSTRMRPNTSRTSSLSLQKILTRTRSSNKDF